MGVSRFVSRKDGMGCGRGVGKVVSNEVCQGNGVAVNRGVSMSVAWEVIC